MKPSELSTFLETTLKAKLPVLIKGAPGVGKTEIIKQATDRAGAKLIISHPVVSDPTDYKGLPFVVNNEAKFLPFGDLNQLIKADKATVYFMDDLGQAPPAVQAAAMQLILERRINGHKVSDQVTFLAATNRKSDRAGVSGILEPVKSRFASIVELEPDVDEWCRWAITNQLPAEIISFIRFRPALLFDFKASTDMTNSPSPRTVHNVAKLMLAGIPKELQYDGFTGAAGEGFARELIAFLEVYKSLPDPLAILVHPDAVDVPSDPATLYALSGALAKKADKSSMKAIVAYAKRMPVEFSVLLITDCVNNDPSVQETKSFIEWSSKNSSILI